MVIGCEFLRFLETWTKISDMISKLTIAIVEFVSFDSFESDKIDKLELISSNWSKE